MVFKRRPTCREMYCDRENIEVLEAITPQLPDFREFLTSQGKGQAEVKTEKGTATAYDLYSCAAVSVCRIEAEQDAVLPMHAHEEHEWLIVYLGAMEITFDDGSKRTLRAREHVYFPPGSSHAARYPENCLYLAIAIPASPGWPA